MICSRRSFAVRGEADLLHRHFLAVAQIDGAIDLAAASLAERFDADQLAVGRPFAANGIERARVLQHRVEMLGAFALEHFAADAPREVRQPALTAAASASASSRPASVGCPVLNRTLRRSCVGCGAHGQIRRGIFVGKRLEIVDRRPVLLCQLDLAAASRASLCSNSFGSGGKSARARSRLAAAASKFFSPACARDSSSSVKNARRFSSGRVARSDANAAVSSARASWCRSRRFQRLAEIDPTRNTSRGGSVAAALLATRRNNLSASAKRRASSSTRPASARAEAVAGPLSFR